MYRIQDFVIFLIRRHLELRRKKPHQIFILLTRRRIPTLYQNYLKLSSTDPKVPKKVPILNFFIKGRIQSLRHTKVKKRVF